MSYNDIPCYIPADAYRLVYSASDNYVKLTDKHTYMVRAKGILPPTPTDEELREDNPLTAVVVGNETDITRALKQEHTTYTMSMGVMWNTGEMASTIPLGGCVLEYRKPSEKRKRRNYGNPNMPSIPDEDKGEYSVDFVMVGIPMDRYNWFKNELANFEPPINLVMTRDKDKLVPKDDPQYIFMSCNINPPNKATFHMDGFPDRTVSAALADLTSNVIGVGVFELHLKRERNLDKEITENHVLSLGLKYFHGYNITNIRTLPIVSGSDGYEPATIGVGNELAAKMAAVALAKNTIKTSSSGQNSLSKGASSSAAMRNKVAYTPPSSHSSRNNNINSPPGKTETEELSSSSS